MQYWDTTTTAALLFTATVTPFEVCLGIPTQVGALWIVNLIINAVFMIDIVVQFFVPVPDLRPESGGELIRSHREIARRYCVSWFWIDLLTCLPFDILTLTVPALRTSDALCGSGSATLLKGIKLLRTLRLIKLIRVIRASRIVQRWETSVSISTSTRSIIGAVVGVCVLLHWIACTWALLPQLMPVLRDEPGLAEAIAARIEEDSRCEACLCDSEPASLPCRNPCLSPCEQAELAALRATNEKFIRAQESWMCRAVSDGLLHPDFPDRPFSTWLAALHVAMLQLLGGSGEIHARNDAEAALFIAAFLVGTIVFAGVQGVVIRVLTTGNPDELAFKQDLDALNFMMRDQHVPHDARVRVRTYFLRTKQLHKRESYLELIERCLSSKLRGDLRHHISRTVFESVWWLAACEPGFLAALSNFIDREAFARDERISSEDAFTGEVRLCILSQGVASRGGAILTSGATWGDAHVTSPMLRDTRAAKAIGYCEVVTLTRAELEEAGRHFPRSARLIGIAGLKMATCRAMIIIAAYTRLLRHRRRARNGHAAPAGASRGGATSGADAEDRGSAAPPSKAAGKHGAANGARAAVRPLPLTAVREEVEAGVASTGMSAEDEVAAGLTAPSEVLLMLRREQLLTTGAWREVDHVRKHAGDRNHRQSVPRVALGGHEHVAAPPSTALGSAVTNDDTAGMAAVAPARNAAMDGLPHPASTSLGTPAAASGSAEWTLPAIHGLPPVRSNGRKSMSSATLGGMFASLARGQQAQAQGLRTLTTQVAKLAAQLQAVQASSYPDQEGSPGSGESTLSA